MSTLTSPRFERLHELASDSQTAILHGNDQPQHPGRAVAAFFDVELSQSNGAHGLTRLIHGHPGDRQTHAACLASSNIHPPIETLRLRCMTPLPPPDVTNRWDQAGVISQQLHRRGEAIRHLILIITHASSFLLRRLVPNFPVPEI